MTVVRRVLLAGVLVLAGCGGGEDPPTPAEPAPAAGPAPTVEPPPQPAPVTPPRVTAPLVPAGGAGPGPAEWRRARAGAKTWLNGLEVDVVELGRNRVQGIKKLAEILDAYLVLLLTAEDEAEREAILERARALTAQTVTPQYHAAALATTKTLQDNAMSYLRVGWVMERLGLDTEPYRASLVTAEMRIRGLLARNRDYKLEMFARFYDHYGFEKPRFLARRYPYGVIEKRVPFEGYLDPTKGYELTHLVFYAYDYGYSKTQTRLTPEDLDYVAEVAPPLMRECMRNNFADLLAELLSCMTYIGRGDDPAAREAIAFLLTHQNPTGNWGSYEGLRARYGAYLEHQWYLHTTLVSLRSLAEAFEGDWPRASR